MANQEKIKLFIDADDTILKSSEAVINILNEEYGIVPPKTYDDLRDWNYKSIYGGLSPTECLKIYESEKFFTTLGIEKGFFELFSPTLDIFEYYIVTKGTTFNLLKKQILFAEKFPEAHFIGIPMYDDNGEWTYSKTSIDMRGGIQIDDRCDCLYGTNAAAKILYTHGRDFYWNRTTEYHIDNRYDCKDWDEITDVLMFFAKNREFLGA